jgi:hypothetical protein
MAKHIKLRVDQITIDTRYQRELDQKRAAAMAKSIDMDRIGVPVVARRPDGKYVVLDGQHRISALNQAGLGTQQILCEVHEGLNLIEEAALFLKLNGGRTAVRTYDKWRAELVAKVPVALEIHKIVTDAGLRITKNTGTNCIMAIDAIRNVHNSKKNLAVTLGVLKDWSGDDPFVYTGEVIKGVSEFLSTYPAVDPVALARKLEKTSPERLVARISRQTSKADRIPFRHAACIVLREIYNFRAKVKLLPLHRVLEADAA